MWGWINTAISKLIWWVIIQGPLNLLAGFWKVFEYLTGNIYLDILFGGGASYDHANQSADGVLWGMPYAFWAFWLVAGFMVILIFAIQYFMLIFQDEENTKQKFLTAVKNTLKGFGLTLVMPAAFFLGCYLMQFFQKVVFAAFGSSDSNLADILYKVGSPDPEHQAIAGGYGAPDGIGSYNIIATILSVWFMLYACAMVGMAMAGKIFELYCLFIISPLFAASYSADGGQRFKTWKDACMAKMLVVVANVLVFMTFLTLLPLVMKLGTNQWNSGAFGKKGSLISDAAFLVFELLVILGGGTFVQTMPTWFASIIGEAAGMAEGKSFADNARAAGGMLRSGALGVAGALGVGATAKGKQLSKFKQKQELNSYLGKGGDLAPAAAEAGKGGASVAEAAIAGAAGGAAAGFAIHGIVPAAKKLLHTGMTGIKATIGSKESKTKARRELKSIITDRADKIRDKAVNKSAALVGHFDKKKAAKMLDKHEKTNDMRKGIRAANDNVRANGWKGKAKPTLGTRKADNEALKNKLIAKRKAEGKELPRSLQ